LPDSKWAYNSLHQIGRIEQDIKKLKEILSALAIKQTTEVKNLGVKIDTLSGHIMQIALSGRDLLGKNEKLSCPRFKATT
jgi:hypothetical protein